MCSADGVILPQGTQYSYRYANRDHMNFTHPQIECKHSIVWIKHGRRPAATVAAAAATVAADTAAKIKVIAVACSAPEPAVCNSDDGVGDNDNCDWGDDSDWGDDEEEGDIIEVSDSSDEDDGGEPKPEKTREELVEEEKEKLRKEFSVVFKNWRNDLRNMDWQKEFGMEMSDPPNIKADLLKFPLGLLYKKMKRDSSLWGCCTRR